MRISLVCSISLGVLLATFGSTHSAVASGSGPDGFVQTGVLVRTDAGGVPYSIMHEIKRVPQQKTAAALVAADVDKRFVITPLRDTSCADFRSMLDVKLARNGARRQAEGALTLACSGARLPAHSRILLNYASRTKVVTLRVERLGTAEAFGGEAMRVVWNAWLGPTEQSDGKALSSHM